MYETLNSQGTRTEVDFVLLGCPHASVDQVRRAALIEVKAVPTPGALCPLGTIGPDGGVALYDATKTKTK